MRRGRAIYSFHLAIHVSFESPTLSAIVFRFSSVHSFENLYRFINFNRTEAHVNTKITRTQTDYLRINARNNFSDHTHTPHNFPDPIEG